MMHYILEVSCYWLGFYLIYVLWLSKETFFATNRSYLLVTLLAGLWLPTLQLQTLGITHPEWIHHFDPVILGVEQLETRLSAVATHSLTSGMSVVGLLLWVYGIGVLFMFGRFALGLLELCRQYRRSEKQIRPGYTLLISDEIHLPFSFFGLLFQGVRTPYSTEELRHITRHELAHIKGWHSIDVLLAELLSIAFWCSPLIYCYKRSLRDVHEYQADASVLQIASKKQYGLLLLRQIHHTAGFAIGNHFFHSQLKKRVVMMNRKQSSQTARWKYLLAIPVLLGMFLTLDNAELTAQSEVQRMHPVMKALSEQTTDPVYKVVEEMPRFPGCEDIADSKERAGCAQQKLFAFVAQHLTYPEAAKEKGVNGKVVVSFVVNKNGEVADQKIMKSLGYGCDEAVLDMMQIMADMDEKWVPGKQRGKAVSVQMNLPVMFKIDPKDKAPSDRQR